MKTTFMQTKENVVRDAEYNETGEIADLINEIKSCDYNRQNPAIERMLVKKASDLDKNQQFLLGRNLLQSPVGHLVPKIL